MKSDTRSVPNFVGHYSYTKYSIGSSSVDEETFVDIHKQASII